MSTQNYHQIAQFEQVRQHVETLTHRSTEIKGRLAPYLKKLWDPNRTLKAVDNLEAFKDLYIRFPNFNEVISYYEVAAIAAQKLDKPFDSMPVLLNGEPGI